MPVHQDQQKAYSELLAIKAALDASSIVAITNPRGIITYVNDKFSEISQYSRKELIGQTHRIVNSGHHDKSFFKNMWQTISSGKTWHGEICNRKKNGHCYWVDTTITPFLDHNDRPVQYIAVRHEITKLKHLQESLKKVSQRILQAQESERERIARDIHDDLGQSLATLKMLIQSTWPIPFDATAHLNKTKVIQYLDTVIDKSRRLSYSLHPVALDILGLKSAIQSLISHFEFKKNLNIQFQCGKIDHLKLQADAINLYRIVQEALNNVVKHSKATFIKIHIQLKNGELCLSIRDNGRGFDLNSESPVLKDKWKHKGIGLSSMEERAKLLGGRLIIQSSQGVGTELRVQVPVEGKR